MEENNNIFLARGHVLVYLAELLHRKYSAKLFWGNPFSTYVSHDQFFNSPPPVRHLYTFFHDLPPFL